MVVFGDRFLSLPKRCTAGNCSHVILRYLELLFDLWLFSRMWPRTPRALLDHQCQAGHQGGLEPLPILLCAAGVSHFATNSITFWGGAEFSRFLTWFFLVEFGAMERKKER